MVIYDKEANAAELQTLPCFFNKLNNFDLKMFIKLTIYPEL